MPRAVSAALWCLATCFVAAAPVVYFASGASDSATETTRATAGVVVLLLAWPLLTGSLRAAAARRPAWSGVRILFIAGALELLADRLATDRTIHGDTAWTAYWLGCLGVWLWLTRAAMHRAERE